MKSQFSSSLTSSKSNKIDSKLFYRLLYYEKPLVGSLIRPKSSSSPPLHIIQSTGQFKIALPIKEERLDNNNNNSSLSLRGDAMVISGPEYSINDNFIRYKLIYFFIFISCFNLIITSLLYFYAHNVDLSKVMPSTIAPNTFSFVQVTKNRTFSEKLIFIITILNLIFGIFGAILQNPLILFLYSLILLLVFFLGYPLIPYMFYSIRYLIDAINLYAAHLLRSKLMINILPFYFVRR